MICITRVLCVQHWLGYNNVLMIWTIRDEAQSMNWILPKWSHFPVYCVMLRGHKEPCQQFVFPFKRNTSQIYHFLFWLELLGADEDVDRVTWAELGKSCRGAGGGWGWGRHLRRQDEKEDPRWETEVAMCEVWNDSVGRGINRKPHCVGGFSRFLFVCQLHFPPSCCTQEVLVAFQLWSAPRSWESSQGLGSVGTYGFFFGFLPHWLVSGIRNNRKTALSDVCWWMQTKWKG